MTRKGPHRSLRAICFDLDGTLCTPTVRFSQVFGEVMAPLLTGRTVSLADLMDRWDRALRTPGPSSSATCLTRALDACGVAAAPSDVARAAAALNRRWADGQALFPDALPTLRRLGAAYPLALITNGPSDAQRAVVAALKLEPYFRWVLISGDSAVGVRKPDTAIFGLAAARVDAEPPALAYVGDSPSNDIAGGHAAGWRTCWLNRAGAAFPAGLPLPDREVYTLEDLTLMNDAFFQRQR